MKTSARSCISIVGILTLFCSFAQAQEAAESGEPVSANVTDASEAGAEEEGAANASGVTFNAAYKTEVLSAFAGGSSGTPLFAGTLNFDVGLDLGKLIQFKGTTAGLSVIASHGDPLTGRVGDIQTSSNLQSTPGARLYQAWLRQSVLSDRLSLTAGIYDLNNEFYVSDAALTLLNSSFGMGAELGVTGVNGPSTFPRPGLGAFVALEPGAGLRLSAGVFEGNSDLVLEEGEGALVIGEAKLRYELAGVAGLEGSVAVGGWSYSVGAQVRGVYAMGEQTFWQADSHAKRSLAGFTRFGWATANADAEAPLIQSNLAAGLTFRAPIPSRIDDVASVGVSHALPGELVADARGETAIEWTYRAQVLRWLAVQPDLQWIVSPGMTADVSDAWVGGVRVEAAI